MKAHFDMMAGYNAWANGRLYAAVAAIPDAEYRREHGAFFGSIHRTLNHLLGSDRIWMKRFTGSGEAPNRLDAVLFEDHDGLTAARRAEDARIVDYVASLDEADLGGLFRYRRVTDPTEIEQPLAPALAHFFNHQTHHRGQVHCLMTQLSGAAPELDLLFYQRETGVGMS